MKKTDRKDEIAVAFYWVNNGRGEMDCITRNYNVGNHAEDLCTLVEFACKNGIWDKGTFYPPHSIVKVTT